MNPPLKTFVNSVNPEMVGTTVAPLVDQIIRTSKSFCKTEEFEATENEVVAENVFPVILTSAGLAIGKPQCHYLLSPHSCYPLCVELLPRYPQIWNSRHLTTRVSAPSSIRLCGFHKPPDSCSNDLGPLGGPL